MIHNFISVLLTNVLPYPVCSFGCISFGFEQVLFWVHMICLNVSSEK